ncbi:MAG: hypothetical protein K2W95_06190 [Candidatus Obscuribacterales bacterium]|nr:hypothetical protein [Candidatus Obscuribacterales bacterium]
MTKLMLATIACLAMLQSLPAFAENVDPEVEKQRNQAISLMSRSKYLDASKIMEHLVEQNPLSARDHYLYGEALYNMGKYMEAAVEFKQARNIEPAKDAYAARCAEAFFAAGRKQEATAMCDLAIPKCTDIGAKKTMETMKKLSSDNLPVCPPPKDISGEQSGSGGRKK